MTRRDVGRAGDITKGQPRILAETSKLGSDPAPERGGSSAGSGSRIAHRAGARWHRGNRTSDRFASGYVARHRPLSADGFDPKRRRLARRAAIVRRGRTLTQHETRRLELARKSSILSGRELRTDSNAWSKCVTPP